MGKWQYTETRTFEIDVPAYVITEDTFLAWFVEHLDAPRTSVEEFIGEAHPIEEGSSRDER